MSIDISVAVDLLFCDDIDDFLSWEFFVLSGFCYESLVCRGTDEGCEEFFFFVALRHVFTLILQCRREAISLVLLHLIIPDQVDQVDDDSDEADEDVVKTRIHERRR